MRHSFRALGAVASIVLVCVLAFGFVTGASGSEDRPELSTQPVGCILDLQGTIGVVICGGEVVDQLPLPTVKITETVVDEIIKTVRIPGPTQTVTVRAPGAETTVTVPGPTRTVTETVRVPGPVVTRTAQPGARPTATATETVTASTIITAKPAPQTTRQTPVEDDTIEDSDGFLFFPDVNFGDERVSAGEVGLSLLAVLGLAGLILLAMYGGYGIGYKDKERRDTNFMRALLESTKLRR